MSIHFRPSMFVPDLDIEYHVCYNCMKVESCEAIISYASGPKGYGTGQKGYRCFDPMSQKLYVSRHVTFLEHIPFYSIPAKAHDVTKSDLHNIDPFASNIDVPTPDVSVSSVDPNMPAPDTPGAHDVPVHEPSTSSGTNVDSPPL
ncbi:hypothetical protein L1987_57166 [Smallanthus sonchifolius]|uniref:Uncharacterized protein n=1 Tax=Smallanthus sonchifolius TaxID=185202 RepID=A0ACB9DC68_9ASTR|nr:hypothetical protein L1987_57166 [Smallanthus sonchifolius]